MDPEIGKYLVIFLIGFFLFSCSFLGPYAWKRTKDEDKMVPIPFHMTGPLSHLADRKKGDLKGFGYAYGTRPVSLSLLMYTAWAIRLVSIAIMIWSIVGFVGLAINSQ